MDNNIKISPIMKRIAKGDMDALSDLYKIAGVSVYSYAFSILKNRQDAEDVLNDCFVTIYKSAGSYKETGKPLAWILTITRNMCLRKINMHKKEILPEEPEKYTDGIVFKDPDERIILGECMKTLSDEERQIVVLHAVAGLKHREIAELYDLALPTVLSKYKRALAKLKKAITKEDING